MDVEQTMVDRTDRDTKRQLDFDDLQKELAGGQHGRAHRFLTNPEDIRSPEGRRKKLERERLRRTLAELMRDPEYAKLYAELGTRLREAETQADTAIAALTARLTQTARRIQEMEDRAARAPDGSLVFRYADGRVAYADGALVADHIADGIIWPKDAPSAEDYFALLLQQHALQDQLSDWTVYRHDVLGDIRDRYDTDDPPMSKRDVQDALEDIEALRPELSRADAPRPISTSVPATGPVALPTILN